MSISGFEDFINSCISDSVNARKTCPRCLNTQIEGNQDICNDCDESIQRQEARNDSGV